MAACRSDDPDGSLSAAWHDPPRAIHTPQQALLSRNFTGGNHASNRIAPCTQVPKASWTKIPAQLLTIGPSAAAKLRSSFCALSCCGVLLAAALPLLVEGLLRRHQQIRYRPPPLPRPPLRRRRAPPCDPPPPPPPPPPE